MTKSIIQVSRFEFSFDPERLFTTRVGLFAADYPDREDRQQLFDELLRRGGGDFRTFRQPVSCLVFPAPEPQIPGYGWMAWSTTTTTGRAFTSTR